MKKTKIAIVIAVILLSTTIVLGTYALLTVKSNEMTNTFVSAKNISAEITETAFNQNLANSYLPGDTLDKNPTIKNTTEDNSIYGALKITYTVTENGVEKTLTADEFAQYASIENMNTTDWEKLSTNDKGEELYFYKNEIAANDSAMDELFQSVVINSDIPTVGGVLPTFNIKITGYATQSQNIDVDTAKTALTNMADANK